MDDGFELIRLESDRNICGNSPREGC